MKIECPVCHVQGVLQQRGRSRRVQHYVGFENGRRIYLYHKVKGMEVSGSNGSKSVEVNKACSDIFNGIVAGGVGFEPTTPNLGGWCSIRPELR